MKTNYVILLAVGLVLLSCNDSEASQELQEEAIEVYLNNSLDPSTRIDSSLALTDKALALNPRNLHALIHKGRMMFVKRDAEGMMETANRLIEYYPDRPFFQMQKAFYLELMGHQAEADNLYQEVIDLFEEDIKEDSTQFDLYIEYLGSLEYAGDSVKAVQVLERLSQRDWPKFQSQILKHYFDERVPKQHLVDYWEGRIAYDEIGM